MAENATKDDIKEMMKALQETIISALKPDIEKITQEILPKLNKKIDCIKENISNIETEQSILKEKVDINEKEIEEIKECTNDFSDCLNKNTKDLEMTNLKIN